MDDMISSVLPDFDYIEMLDVLDVQFFLPVNVLHFGSSLKLAFDKITLLMN